MNILVIGNGFDLAHGLPTTYSNFLNFIDIIRKIPNTDYSVKCFRRYLENKVTESVGNYICSLLKANIDENDYICNIFRNNNNSILSELINKSTENTWIDWFIRRKTKIKSTWIDFEAEISDVVKYLERIYSKCPLRGYNDVNELLKIDELHIIDFFSKPLRHSKFLKPSIQELNLIKKRMVDDLNNLVRCLEIYLSDCIGTFPQINISQDIFYLSIDKVLNFNYTDTYERLYFNKSKNIEFDYIHGKAKIDNSISNNMVLGIDEYLENEEQNKNTIFIQFKKYYQRIYKKTGCNYKKWIESFDNQTSEVNVYFFGHSLNITDSDILCDLIKNEKTKITIFYYSEGDYGDKIANLVRVIGQNNLISMVHGSSPKIVFQMQRNMIDKDNSEWEIMNDVSNLYHWYTLSDNELELLVEKIRCYVSGENINYFHSQRNLINLFDSLLYVSDDFVQYKDALLNIADKLSSNSTIDFDYQEWNSYDFNGEIICKSDVAEFIEKINERNKHRRKSVNYNIENPEKLLQQIKETPVNEIEAFELLDNVIHKFRDTNNAELLWECVFAIKNCVSFEKWKENISKKIEASKGISKLRYEYILETIIEEKYYMSINDHTEEYD